MSDIEIYQIDAFSDRVFHGNPAAVCLLDAWLNDELMQAIAAENNLSETAFVIEDATGHHIRWFAPNGEISLCGHATLAAGFVLFELGKTLSDTIHFHSLSGQVSVKKRGAFVELDFPSIPFESQSLASLPDSLVDKEIIEAWNSPLDLVLVLGSELEVQQAKVNANTVLNLPNRGLVLTSQAKEFDFYSRCFYPKHNIIEDPVTGSAHCILTPLWGKKLDKVEMHAMQGLERRGYINCLVHQGRVFLTGSCRWYFKGTLVI